MRRFKDIAGVSTSNQLAQVKGIVAIADSTAKLNGSIARSTNTVGEDLLHGERIDVDPVGDVVPATDAVKRKLAAEAERQVRHWQTRDSAAQKHH